MRESETRRIPCAAARRTGGTTLGLIACCAFAALTAAPSIRAAASLEVYGRLPRYENVVLSPDGSRVAFIRTDGNTRTVAVLGLADGKKLGELRAGEQKLRGIRWADNDRLMIFTSVTAVPTSFLWHQSEWRQLQILDLKSGRNYRVPQLNPPGSMDLMNTVTGRVTVRHIQDRTVLFFGGLQVTGAPMSHGLGRQVVTVLLREDLESNSPRIVRTGGRGLSESWTVDDAGEVAAEELYDQRSHRWSILVSRDGRMTEAAAGEAAIDVPRILGAGPVADTLLLQRIEDGDAVWRLLSLKDGSIGAPMAEKQTLDQPVEDPLTFRMIGGVHVGDSEEYLFFDPSVQQSWQAAVRAFPNERVRFESAAAGFKKLVVRVEGERDGYCYELIDLTTHRAEPLGDVYEGIGKPLEVRRITYAAADGLAIPAYLTLPRGKSASKLPLIVLPHDNPAGRDTADFNWWSQALAAQGYAVLQPNYRGSELNRAFLEKGFGEWGRKMQTDLSDGVRYLAREGVIDPARVCIVGASYGGYAALAGVALNPTVYRCAVSVAGIADLHSWLHSINRQHYGRDTATQRYWERFIGASNPDDVSVDAISPLRHPDAITVPVLLIHGRDDTVVPYEQSQTMYDALHGAHKDAELVPLAGEDHWLSRSETRLQMLQSSVAFLRAHNPPDP
ncbi:MAG TPA: S9 family peptidase [Steroidobacteraceae bacterium]|jgi:dienelactone hydrolase|nr:S9 family peptidase [Steroidobacteraceae bacterium]